MPRRFPPPWQTIEREESFVIQDADGQAVAARLPDLLAGEPKKDA